jgi:transposase
MDDNPTIAAAESTAKKISGAQTHFGSRGADRNPLCAQDGHGLARPALGVGLWQRHDLLASAARLAESWRLGKTPSRVVAPIARGRSDRLVAGRGGFEQCACGFWGLQTGPNPTDRRKAGSKHHLCTDAQGIPLSAQVTAANVHDSRQLQPLVLAIPALRGKTGRPRQRPEAVQGDRAYGSRAHHRWLQSLGIADALARKGWPHGSGLGKTRWVVERTLSWLHQFRRLRIRYERRADIHQAFLTLGCAIICHRALKNSF